MKTKSQEMAADIAALLRARAPLLWIVTREEARTEQYLIEAAAAAGYAPRTWDCAQGVTTAAGGFDQSLADPGAALQEIGRQAGATEAFSERRLWIMRDLAPWLEGAIGMTVSRQLRNLARALPYVPGPRAQAIVVLSPSNKVPAEIASHATVIEWPMPDRAEIAAILDASLEVLDDATRASAGLDNGSRDAAIDAALGLSGEEAQGVYSKSLVQFRRIDAAAVAREKKRVVAREGVLEWFDPLPGGLDSVGGLDLLKEWLTSRSQAYSPAARAYGLPAPKGALFVGIPGCGKSLLAKAMATAWQCPLIRMDLNALKSKFVGESEGNLRKAFALIEAIGRCVVWIDEIEKALQGATSGSSDGGVSADALGGILSWMQERRGEAFVIATANDVSSLPPELLRKGRFDEVWFVDLPNADERQAILKASLAAHGRVVLGDMRTEEIATACNGFTGSEIAAIVPDALFTAFADGAREIETGDLITAAKTVVPLAVTAKEKIAALRDWAKGRARPASAPATAPKPQARVRAVDIG